MYEQVDDIIIVWGTLHWMAHGTQLCGRLTKVTGLAIENCIANVALILTDRTSLFIKI